MVRYKDDPNLKELQVVTTVSGEKEYRKNCKYIRQQYYVIERDCFQVSGTWHTLQGGLIAYDWERKEYVLKNQVRLIHGIVENESGKLELGYFSPNSYNNIQTHSSMFNTVIAMSEDILGKDWFEDLGNHTWFFAPEISPSNIQGKKAIRNSDNPAARGYNIEDNKQDLTTKVDLYSKYKTVITPQIKQLAKYIGDISFGCEFEIAQGFLPYNLQCRYGVVPVRDGSLNGGSELVTIAMDGAKGLQTIINLADDLSKRALINLDCSLHIHFGNIGTDKLSIISLYKLCRSLQEELFTMFPYYKTNPEGIKQKNYTKKLPKLNIGVLKDISKEAYEAYLLDSWNKLFSFYAEKSVTLDTFNKKTREHPIHNKWSRPSRYCFMNFMNLFFTHRHTMEARLSSATTNRDKVINWFLICNAIIRYSQRYAKDIITKEKTISLKEVLEIYPTLHPNDSKAAFLSKYLHNYFLERQALCKKDLNKGDFKSMWDINDDKQYRYNYMGINLLE